MSRVERDLLRLSEEIIWIAIERHLANAPHRNQFFWYDFGCIQQIKSECELVRFLDNLHAEFVFGIISHLDGFPQITPEPIGVLASQLLCLVPDQRVHSQHWLPMELDEASLALFIDEAEGMDAETLHHAKAAWNSSVR